MRLQAQQIIKNHFIHTMFVNTYQYIPTTLVLNKQCLYICIANVISQRFKDSKKPLNTHDYEKEYFARDYEPCLAVCKA